MHHTLLSECSPPVQSKNKKWARALRSWMAFIQASLSPRRTQLGLSSLIASDAKMSLIRESCLSHSVYAFPTGLLELSTVLVMLIDRPIPSITGPALQKCGIREFVNGMQV